MLFDELEPKDDSPRRYGEPAYSFLNRSSQPKFQAVRRRLELWLTRYPALGRSEIAIRFRSLDDFHHRAAFFELLVHELLLCSGCAVEVHRSGVASRKVPDFLVMSGGRPVCIEAVLVAGESDQERSSQKRINAVYDVLNKLESPNFFIGVELHGSPNTPPPARAIVSFIEEHLVDLDADAIGDALKDGMELDGLPRWKYEHDGWKIRFFPIPKSPKLRGKPGVRPMGMIIPEVKWDSSRLSLQKALEKKAGKYGKHQMPFIIAVNAATALLDHTDVTDALFGSDAVTVTQTIDGSYQHQHRLPDGLWCGKSGPRYKRVSAVLVFHEALPWNVDTVSVQLYLNPWAEKPYDGELAAFERWVVNDGHLVIQPGITLGELLTRGHGFGQP
jgi:hypothetical protein